MVRATRRLDRAPVRVGRTAMIGLIVALVFPGAATAARPGRGPSPSPLRWLAALPNDPEYPASQAPYLRTMGVPSAWDVTTGSASVVVAVLDSGVDAAHPDLVGRVVAGRNVVAGNDDTADDLGHGTKMAGIIGAATNNALGVAGVAWAVKILPVKVTSPSGAATDADVAAGIFWAVDHGANLINLALGAPGVDNVLDKAVEYARAHDVLIVAAAGNSGSDVPEYPAANRGVVAVGATDASGRRTRFSNYGPWVDVNAPGVDILTTRANSLGFTEVSGTSASCSAALRVLAARSFDSASSVTRPRFRPASSAPSTFTSNQLSMERDTNWYETT